MAPRKGEKAVTTLKNCTVAIAGHLGDEWSSESVERWCSYNGATYSNIVDADVTHLLATPKQFKDRVSAVKAALQYKKTHIVTKDWFEDCLTKKRHLKETPYSLKEDEKKANAKKRREEKAQKAMEKAVDFVNTTTNHIYRDSTYFSYEVLLTRQGEEHVERYVLYLFESNAKPHLYHFAAKFYKKPRDSHPGIYRPSQTAKRFSREFAEFKEFFRQKTGLHWDDRIAKAGTVLEGKFQYQPPTGGKPVGIIANPSPQDKTIPTLDTSTGPDLPAEPQSNKKPQVQPTEVIDLTASPKRKLLIEDIIQQTGKEKRQRLDNGDASSLTRDHKRLKNTVTKDTPLNGPGAARNIPIVIEDDHERKPKTKGELKKEEADNLEKLVSAELELRQKEIRPFVDAIFNPEKDEGGIQGVILD
ncbi:uncharacterized protein F4822DRAFT_433163 [Hypoxylon trugodes]|uniref:uncharacterized protein n=1 Tax=Hypoxylon trugodes TaxID=326681 RepID=UPI00218D2A81|nr:uncharacterized protein F4822DRAFT_433163 [Hypoxylon trugodes]KAI1384622.1 hypothetical protein F4822DRAFT_433163 [Hypoxylon trugodes]